jgi:cyclophilin family peptidyl-prolyl cis-trans isomerase/predicted DsbA family dithiol-disulfide isomerase
MSKKPCPYIPFIFAFILLAGCTQPTPTAIPSPTSVPTPTSTPTALPCTLLHVQATPEALGAEFGERGHVTGPADAAVTIVVFSDYQCPACAVVAASLKLIRMTHAGDVRLVLVNTPLSDRDKDNLATQAVEAADLQGKFWEMHDLLFEKQADWSALAPADFEKWLLQQAENLGMDPVQFQADANGETVANRLQQAVQISADQAIVPPILFVNSSSRYTGLANYASLDTVVRMEALSARQFSSCPAWLIDPLKQYIAILHTAKGDMSIQLFPDKAPEAVNNFIFLARSGWYNDITFYKMIPNSLVMSGDPSETGLGNPGYIFKTEIPANLQFDRPGILAMDNNGPNTNGSRFLITLAPAAESNGQFTIFGKVLTGMDVLYSLSPRNSLPGDILPEGDKLISITIHEH